MLSKFVRIFLESDRVITEELASPKPNQVSIIHLLVNAMLLNAGFAFLFIEVPVIAIFYFILLSVVTAIAIPVIEYLTYLTAKSKGGQGSFWDQLRITNIYVTPISFAFFILMIISAFLPKGLNFGVDFIAYACVLMVNNRKIKLIHKIDKDLLPQIVYGLTVAFAYFIWICALLLPLLIIGLTAPL
ncbi:Uncharacterised protein [Candidatus Bilamarchaeum dharawalense]|uniref:Yip1 domain-containing protein n=1 Tax=Candidatus Bilamarchaeum dharawalense TaxID=2885759 RepID=A0A5E4LQC4_9ARCH|nr:Uncharacterised protein [Candidatus Bilamarchaeum dharawalense]